MATDPLCSAAATRIVLYTSYHTAFVIEGGTIFYKAGTMLHLGTEWGRIDMLASNKNNGSGTKELAKQGCPVTNYRHFSYTWHHQLAQAVYVSIYSDVQIFADEIFVDGCWSTKTTNIKPREKRI